MQHDEELNSFILVGDTGEELGQVNLLIQSSTAFQQENNNDLNELMNDDFVFIECTDPWPSCLPNQ